MLQSMQPRTFCSRNINRRDFRRTFCPATPDLKISRHSNASIYFLIGLPSCLLHETPMSPTTEQFPMPNNGQDAFTTVVLRTLRQGLPMAFCQGPQTIFTTHLCMRNIYLRHLPPPRKICLLVCFRFLPFRLGAFLLILNFIFPPIFIFLTSTNHSRLTTYHVVTLDHRVRPSPTFGRPRQKW